MAAGELPPLCISTDLHTLSLKLVGGLTDVMTRALACGLPLAEVLRGVTRYPAQVLGLRDWCRGAGTLDHATIFSLTRNAGGETLFDSAGERLVPDRRIDPVAIVRNRRVRTLAPPGP